MQECTNKQVIISALYYYQNHASYDEQVACLNMFGCEPHKSVTLETDANERATLFESVIALALSSLDDDLY